MNSFLIARDIRRYTAMRLAMLGFILTCTPPAAKKRAVARMRARGQNPIFIDIPFGILSRMARILGPMIADALAYQTRGSRQRVAELSAIYAVALYTAIANSGQVVEGTEDAIFDVLRFMNETLLCLPTCEPYRVEESRPAALAGITDVNIERGTRVLAAAIRGMFRIRTTWDFAVEYRWMAVAAGIAVMVGGCVAGR